MSPKDQLIARAKILTTTLRPGRFSDGDLIETDEIGQQLVSYTPTRDLDAAIELLTALRAAVKGYEPGLCFLAEAHHKKGEYEKAAEIALDAHGRALHSPEWSDSPPPAPLEIAARAFRKLAGDAKKAGRPADVTRWYAKLKETGQSTATDLKRFSQS